MEVHDGEGHGGAEVHDGDGHGGAEVHGVAAHGAEVRGAEVHGVVVHGVEDHGAEVRAGGGGAVVAAASLLVKPQSCTELGHFWLTIYTEIYGILFQVQPKAYRLTR